MAAQTFKQPIVSLFGQPVAENPTQYMMERAFAHDGLDWRYLTLEVAPEDLGAAVRGMRAMGFRGGNCTIPHKAAVIEHLDGLSEAARLMGAVNTIARQGNELLGENTDGKGFVQSLREVTDPVGKRVVLLGAGGAARAIAVELAMARIAGLVIVNRTPKRGRELAELIVGCSDVQARSVAWQGEFEIPPDTDVLINATPIGLFPDVDALVPIRAETLRAETIVCDVVPNPPQTPFLHKARERGCTTLDGLGMLVRQGVIAYRLWTGLDPDPSVMRAALKEVLET